MFFQYDCCVSPGKDGFKVKCWFFNILQIRNVSHYIVRKVLQGIDAEMNSVCNTDMRFLEVRKISGN